MIVHINEYHNKYTNTEKYKIHLQLIVIHLFWKSSKELSITGLFTCATLHKFHILYIPLNSMIMCILRK